MNVMLQQMNFSMLQDAINRAEIVMLLSDIFWSLWPLFVASVWPNMLNMPVSATGYHGTAMARVHVMNII